MAEVPLPPGYVLVERLGSGGFATVWLAEQGRLGRRVAVKVLGETLGDAERERRFLAECRAIGRLSGHPSVVTVHDAGTTDQGHPYLVMEHLPGGSLHDRVHRQGHLPWVEVLRIGVQVADALAAAHDAGILHRDVKPANVLLDENGSPKLGDFGIARLSEGTNTATGALVGTIPFTPPEVLSGHRPGPTADVWALGATLHALLSGSSPFGGHREEPPAATIARVLRSEPPPLGPEVPAALRDLIFAMLAADPADRPQSAAAVVLALQVIQADRGLEITPARVTRTAPPSEPAGLANATAVGLPALDTPQPTTHPAPPPPVAPPPPPSADGGAPRTTGPETWEPPGGAGTPPPPPPPAGGPETWVPPGSAATPPPPPVLAKDAAPPLPAAPETWEAPGQAATPPPPPPVDPGTAVLPGAAADAAPGAPPPADGATAVLPAAGPPGEVGPPAGPEAGTAVLPQAGAAGYAGAPPAGPGAPGAPLAPPPRRDEAGGRSKAPLLIGVAAVVVLVVLAAAAFLVLGGGGDDDADGDTSTSEGAAGTDGGDGGDQGAGAASSEVTTNLGTPVQVPSGPGGNASQAWATEADCSPPSSDVGLQCGAVAVEDDVVTLVPDGSGGATLRRTPAGDVGQERWSLAIQVGAGLGGLTRVGETLMVSYNLDDSTRRYQTFTLEGAKGPMMDLPLDGRPALPNPQPAQGAIVVVLIDTGEIAVLDLAGGGNVTVPGALVASDQSTLWALVDGVLTAYDLPTGELRTTVDGVVPTAIVAPAVPYQRSGVLAGGFLYATTDEGVAVVNTESLEVVTTLPYAAGDGTDLGAPLAISATGDLVVVATTGGAMAVQAADQQVRWAVALDTPLLPEDSQGSVWVASGSRLVVGMPGSGLQAVDLGDGSIVASLPLSAEVSASTVVPYAGGLAVLDKTTVTGYSLEDLKPQWSATVAPGTAGLAATAGGLAAASPTGVEGLQG